MIKAIITKVEVVTDGIDSVEVRYVIEETGEEVKVESYTLADTDAAMESFKENVLPRKITELEEYVVNRPIVSKVEEVVKPMPKQTVLKESDEFKKVGNTVKKLGAEDNVKETVK